MRPMPSFQYYRPTSVEEVLELLDSLDSARPIAGGTDLVPLLREGVVKSEHLVDLNRVAELNYVKAEEGYVCIGAATTHSQVMGFPIIKDNPKPTQGEIEIGIEGNICRCTGYTKIIAAIHDAAERMSAE